RVEKQQDKTIELTANGDIFLDGKAASKDDLEIRLRALPADASFLIRADRAVALQSFIDVADVLKRLNFTKVAVQTKSGAK
ncbi:MAG: biopolymer transporter ExbD, partial [Bauldia sp.]